MMKSVLARAKIFQNLKATKVKRGKLILNNNSFLYFRIMLLKLDPKLVGYLKSVNEKCVCVDVVQNESFKSPVLNRE